MPVSAEYRTETLSILNLVAPVTGRSMFGGVGLYSEGLIFALMAEDRLYFKVDDSNRPDFEAAGMEPFHPFGDAGQTMGYYEVPPFVLDSPDELSAWLDKSLRVAELKRARTPAPWKKRA
jgi:DNA transformation protein